MPGEAVPQPDMDLEVGEKDSKVGAHDSPHYTLTVHNLTYKVTKKTKNGVEEKILLNNVSATAKYGQITAVVGPSGAGKSTFLDAVASRIDPKSLQGAILVNGKPMEPSFRRLSGYVMQDDQLFPMLTVRETLLFSARLRLPGDMSHTDKLARVDMLIEELGLTSCAGTKIGNAEHRGVSGGERRRVSIGVDLIHDPPVLFLDEPTSGLDSTSALNCVQILHDIAEQRRRTIVLTIHQPSFRILELIHNFLILAKGHTIYHGPYPGLIGYFTEYGRSVPDHVNVLEYALDVIEEEQNSEAGLETLVKFQESKEVHEKGLSIQSSLGQLPLAEFATGFIPETIILADRNFKNISRTQELFAGRLGLMVVTGLVLGSLFFNVNQERDGIQKRQSFIAFALALLLFTSTEALPIFLEERQIYIRETSRGAYRTSSYVLANAVVFLPFLFILALIFSSVSYYMVGLVSSAAAFFTFVCILFLTLAVANSYVTFWGALVPNFIAGNTVITATTAFFFLFSGFFIKRDDIPKYWIWFHYLSTFKYPLELLQQNEYGKISGCWNTGEKTCASSQELLESFSVADVHMWENFLVMTLFYVAYRVFFYIALSFQTKAVRK